MQRNSFRGSFRGLVTAAVVSVSVLLLACPIGQLHILIPDFETSDVQGIQLYRVADGSGQLEDAGTIEFLGIQTKPPVLSGSGDKIRQLEGAETMQYVQHSTDASSTFGPVYTTIVRDPSQPGAIEVTLAFLNELPAGWFKVASYNTHGTSNASANQVFIVGEEG